MNAYHGLHITLCALFIISLDNFMINVKVLKIQEIDSIVWFTDTLGFNKEHAISSYCSSATLLIVQNKSQF